MKCLCLYRVLRRGAGGGTLVPKIAFFGKEALFLEETATFGASGWKKCRDIAFHAQTIDFYKEYQWFAMVGNVGIL